MSALLDTPAWHAFMARCDRAAALAYSEAIVAIRNGFGTHVLAGTTARRDAVARTAEPESEAELYLLIGALQDQWANVDKSQGFLQTLRQACKNAAVYQVDCMFAELGGDERLAELEGAMQVFRDAANAPDPDAAFNEVLGLYPDEAAELGLVSPDPAGPAPG